MTASIPSLVPGAPNIPRLLSMMVSVVSLRLWLKCTSGYSAVASAKAQKMMRDVSEKMRKEAIKINRKLAISIC
jgi:hypothetical protein